MSHKSSECFLHSSSLTDHSLNHLEQIIIPCVVLVAAVAGSPTNQRSGLLTPLFLRKHVCIYIHVH